MTNPTKSGLLTALGEDLRVFRHGASGRWRGAAQRLRRRLRRGEPDNSAAVTTPDAKPKPSLLALLEDDIRQSLGALSAELKRLRGKIRPSLEGHQDEGVATSASPSRQGSGSPGCGLTDAQSVNGRQNLITQRYLLRRNHILNIVNSWCGCKFPQECCSQHSLVRLVLALP